MMPFMFNPFNPAFIPPAETGVVPLDELKELSKLEKEGEGIQTSQASTMGSLGNLEEHKTSRLEKLGAQISQKLKKGTESQVRNIRSMILRVFGEKVDPSRDNDQDTRQVLKQVNEEIKGLLKRKEEVIEGEGQGPIMQPLPQSHAIETINEMRDKIAHQVPHVKKEFHDIANVAMHQLGQIKQKFVQTFGEKVNPAKDLDPSVKSQLTRLNEDIRKLPRKNERVIETVGTEASWDTPDVEEYWF